MREIITIKIFSSILVVKSCCYGGCFETIYSYSLHYIILNTTHHLFNIRTFYTARCSIMPLLILIVFKGFFLLSGVSLSLIDERVSYSKTISTSQYVLQFDFKLKISLSPQSSSSSSTFVPPCTRIDRKHVGKSLRIDTLTHLEPSS